MEIASLLVLLLLFAVAWLIWAGMFLSNDPTEEIIRTPRHQFLGPGGPDDPFADDPYDS
jgi:hypothetical protein